jgi:hypothetical protein
VLGQTAYFGSSRQEQSENRQEAFEEIFQKLSRGSKVGNTYFQSFMQHGVQDFPFADFVIFCVPTSRKSASTNTSRKPAHCQFGVLKSCWPVSTMTLQMMNIFKCWKFFVLVSWAKRMLLTACSEDRTTSVKA